VVSNSGTIEDTCAVAFPPHPFTSIQAAVNAATQNGHLCLAGVHENVTVNKLVYILGRVERASWSRQFLGADRPNRREHR